MLFLHLKGWLDRRGHRYPMEMALLLEAVVSPPSPGVGHGGTLDAAPAGLVELSQLPSPACPSSLNIRNISQATEFLPLLNAQVSCFQAF